jgi:hypothetical protein
MKRVIPALLIVVGLVGSACGGPPAVAPPPPPDRWPEVLKRTIEAAVDNVFGSAPNNTSIDCAVVIEDAHVNPADYSTEYTPVHVPNDIYAWITGCLGVGSGTHSVPTFKASGYTNGPNPNKQAVCWATSFPPDGDMKFPCTFDRDPHTSWVVDLRLSRDGHVAVGVVS